TDVANMIMLCQHHHVLVHTASITITKRRGRPGHEFTRISGTTITAQRPDQHSKPGPADGNPRPHADDLLLRELANDTLELDSLTARSTPPVTDTPATDPDAEPGYRLPTSMREFNDIT